MCVLQRTGVDFPASMFTGSQMPITPVMWNRRQYHWSLLASSLVLGSETDSVSKIKWTGSWRMTLEFVLWSLLSACLSVYPSPEKDEEGCTHTQSEALSSTVRVWDFSILIQWSKIEQQLESLAEVTRLIYCLRSCYFSTESVATVPQLITLVRSSISSHFCSSLSQKNCKSRLRGLTGPTGLTQWGSHT